MSDVSKYRNLPGIALDQPDVYETSDLPEVDQISRRSATIHDGDQSDNVSIIAVKPEEAFDAFKDKVVDSDNVDFREPVGRRPMGYQSFGDWEIMDSSSRDRETPLQKFRRLQAEVSELTEGLKAVKEPKTDVSRSTPSFSGGLSPTDIFIGLQQLTNQLKGLNVEEWAESNILYGVDSSAKVYTELCSKIESIKEAKSEKTDEPLGASGATMTYQLLYNTELSKNKELAKLNAIEQRIKRLESILGNDNQKISFLTNLTDDKSLVEAVNVMSARISLLDSSHLESIESRLKTLLTKLNQIAEKRSQIEDVEKQSKIDELYDVVVKSEKSSASLPLIASRLNSLSDLQEQAVQFSSALSYIDSLQTQIEESMTNNEKELNALKESFINNIDAIKKMMDNLNKRLDQLN